MVRGGGGGGGGGGTPEVPEECTQTNRPQRKNILTTAPAAAGVC